MSETIKPCPNPECRGECQLVYEGYDDGDGAREDWHYVECNDCDYRGPRADDEPEAIRLHNAMPRAEPWQNGEPPGFSSLLWDIVSGRTVITRVKRTRKSGVLCWVNSHDRVIPDDEVMHWRPHTIELGPA